MSKELAIAYNDLNDNEVKLSPAIVKKYLCPDANITEQEMVMFLKLCQHQQLNPFLREVYLVKYGNQKATMVTGKETFLKRAKRDPGYSGHEAGTTGEVCQENLKGWAKVYIKDYQVPITVEVEYEEYVGTKKDGTPNKMWAAKPKTMLRKVALVQALREAFPDTFGGLYSQEEIDHVDSEALPTAEVQVESDDALKPDPAPPAEKAPEPEPAAEPEVVEGEMVEPEGKAKAEPAPEPTPAPAPEPVAEPAEPDPPLTAEEQAAEDAHGNMSDDDLPLAEGVADKILITFKKMGKYDMSYLEKAVDKPRDKWTKVEREKLVALYNRIKARQS